MQLRSRGSSERTSARTDDAGDGARAIAPPASGIEFLDGGMRPLQRRVKPALQPKGPPIEGAVLQRAVVEVLSGSAAGGATYYSSLDPNKTMFNTRAEAEAHDALLQKGQADAKTADAKSGEQEKKADLRTGDEVLAAILREVGLCRAKALPEGESYSTGFNGPQDKNKLIDNGAMSQDTCSKVEAAWIDKVTAKFADIDKGRLRTAWSGSALRLKPPRWVMDFIITSKTGLGKVSFNFHIEVPDKGK